MAFDDEETSIDCETSFKKETGILIITIDDNELSHLDCILMSMFPEYDRFIVTIEHSKRGRRGKTWLTV